MRNPVYRVKKMKGSHGFSEYYVLKGWGPYPEVVAILPTKEEARKRAKELNEKFYMENPVPRKGAVRKFEGTPYHYIGRSLYPGKAHAVASELRDVGIRTKLTQRRDIGTMIWASKPVYVPLMEVGAAELYNPIPKSTRNPTKGSFVLLALAGLIGWLIYRNRKQA